MSMDSSVISVLVTFRSAGKKKWQFSQVIPSKTQSLQSMTARLHNCQEVLRFLTKSLQVYLWKDIWRVLQKCLHIKIFWIHIDFGEDRGGISKHGKPIEDTGIDGGNNFHLQRPFDCTLEDCSRKSHKTNNRVAVLIYREIALMLSLTLNSSIMGSSDCFK